MFSHIPMHVYIAAPNELLEDARLVRTKLKHAGIVVTSRWLNGLESLSDRCATMDLADVDAADVLLLLNPLNWERSGTGGRHVELGYALARQKKILIVGVRSNVFHYLTDVCVVPWGSDLAKECALCQL